jgi:hypothetical protein
MSIPCEFRADVIARTPGGGRRRIANQQCVAEQGHADEHEFITAGEHIFGASFEAGRYVARR